jgi:hypothetical protein
MSSSRKTRRRTPHLNKARLAEMIGEATVDAYGESEQTTGWFTMIDENLAVPFETKVLDVTVVVERVDLDETEHIVAIGKRGRSRQAIRILDLPLPTPPPAGADWIEAYRQWSRGTR